MKKPENNYAFIDSRNLNLGVLNLGWRLDFLRFRVYLKDKYGVTTAYLFIGYVPGNEKMYASLQKFGYICIFKPTLELPDGSVKGNVDAELVLHTMIENSNFDKAVIVSGDGDFCCLIRHLISNQKCEAVIVPNQYKYSALLKFRAIRPYLRFINDSRGKLGK